MLKVVTGRKECVGNMTGNLFEDVTGRPLAGKVNPGDYNIPTGLRKTRTQD